MELAAPARPVTPATAPHLPTASALPKESPSSGFSRAKACKALALPLATLGLASRGQRRARVARAGAPPASIWQTKRKLAVAQLERQWLLPAEDPSESQVAEEPKLATKPEDLPQAFLRFLGGSVLMAVLAQASFPGKRGPDMSSGI
eukprot:s1398_g7.t1